MNILYIEPFSGLSGDMLLGAFCGLTDAYEEIEKLPEKLKLTDGQVVIQDVNKNGIACKHVKIIDLNEHHHHHHDHPHVHVHPTTHGHHDHDYDHHHEHENEHAHSGEHHHHHHHAHRHLKDIYKIIDEGAISDGAKSIAKAIFKIIGASESRIHNVPLDKIHFHEVSAVDSILDIVGCAVLLDKLKIEKTYSDAICTGSGMVKTQHGMLPVPAPATADIIRGMPSYKGGEKGEKLTPTGAAILKYLNPDFNPPVINATKIAYGPGQKDFVMPNVVRVSLVEETKKKLKSQEFI